MEGNGKLSFLPLSTIRLIGSSQVITSVYSVVKELIENSFDAHSTLVDVKLENYGLDKIEIKDNGSGIRLEDVPYVGQRHYTSKITTHADLQSLETYGFRGEALASLCSVADVTLTTKTKDDDISTCYTLTNEGKVKESKPSHFGKGTTICASNLFKNLPVRKQYHNTVKKKKAELKKIEDLLRAYSIIKPGVRISLWHNKDLVVQKIALPDTKTAMFNVLGHQVMSLLEHISEFDENTKMKIEAYLPKPGSDILTCSRATNDMSFLAVNQRYVTVPEIEKLIKQYYSNCHACQTSRYPVYYMSITLPLDKIDVNLDPNKSKVYIEDMDICKKLTEQMLEYTYGPLDDPPYWKKQSNDKHSGPVVENRNKDVQEHLVQFERQTDKLLNKTNSSHDNTVLQSTVIDSNSNHISSQQFDTSVSLIDFDETFGEEENCIPDKNPNSSVSSNNILNTVGSGCNEKKISTVDSIDPSSVSDENKKRNSVLCESQATDVTNGSCISLDVNSTVTPEVTEPSVNLGDFDMSDDLLSEVIPTQSTSADTSKMASAGCEIDDVSKSMENDEMWTRGVICGSSDKIIQPVTLLPPGLQTSQKKRPLSPNCTKSNPPEKKPRPVMNRNITIGQTTLYDLIENQPVKRPQTPLELYMKDVRSKVVEENPEATYAEVDKIIEDTWDDLPSEERRKYIHKSKPNSAKPFTLVGSKNRSETMSISERLLKSVKKPRRYRSDLPIKDVPFSISKLKNKYSTGFLQSQCPSDVSWKVIGCLQSCGMWACSLGLDLYLGNPHRMSEVVLYDRLMKDYSCSTHILEKPVKLTPRTVGGEEAWSMIQKLAEVEKTQGQYVSISDKHIICNGFKLKCYTNKETSEFTCELVEIANYIPTYGVQDLCEVLSLMSSSDNNLSLESTRPLKVCNYLKGEAVRMTRSRKAQREEEEIKELIDTIFLEERRHDGDVKCLHNKDIFHTIYSMSDLPQVQDESYATTQS